MGLLHQSENTPSGSVVPFWLPSLPSSRCGSPSKSTMRVDPPSCTVNVSEVSFQLEASVKCYISFPIYDRFRHVKFKNRRAETFMTSILAFLSPISSSFFVSFLNDLN